MANKKGLPKTMQKAAANGTIPAATTTVRGTVKKAAAQVAFAGADLAAVKVELNAFLVKLQNAGLIG
jgi:hypothetical protein